MKFAILVRPRDRDFSSFPSCHGIRQRHGEGQKQICYTNNVRVDKRKMSIGEHFNTEQELKDFIENLDEKIVQCKVDFA